MVLLMTGVGEHDSTHAVWPCPTGTGVVAVIAITFALAALPLSSLFSFVSLTWCFILALPLARSVGSGQA